MFQMFVGKKWIFDPVVHFPLYVIYFSLSHVSKEAKDDIILLILLIGNWNKRNRGKNVDFNLRVNFYTLYTSRVLIDLIHKP